MLREREANPVLPSDALGWLKSWPYEDSSVLVPSYQSFICRVVFFWRSFQVHSLGASSLSQEKRSSSTGAHCTGLTRQKALGPVVMGMF